MTRAIQVAIIIVLQALILSGCASEPSSDSPPPGQMAATLASLKAQHPAPSDYVAALLQAAPNIRVDLSEDDLQRVVQAYKNNYTSTDIKEDEDNIRSQLARCNDNGYQSNYSGALWQTAETECDILGTNLAPPPGVGFHDLGLGVNSPEAEVAFARSCTLPLVQGVMVTALGCAHLIQLYQHRGSLEKATAVLQDAQKCQGTLTPEASVHAIDGTPPDSAHDELRNCLVDGAEVLHKLHRFAEERTIDENLCHGADESGCELLAALGASVNMAAVEEKQQELQAADQANAEVVREQRVEKEASFDAKMQALRSAADSNSNAIVDTANQAAANMVAVGAANDAARQAKYREQLEPHQAQGTAGQKSGAGGQIESQTSSSSQQSAAASIPRYLFVEPVNQCLKVIYAPNQDPSYWLQNTCSVSISYDWTTPAGKWGVQEGLTAGEKGATLAPPVQYFACPTPYWPSPVQATPSDGDPIPYNGRFECVTANPAWLRAQ